MRVYGYSPVPFLVAFILPPVAEKSFFQTLMLADDSYWTFGLRLMSGTLLLITILVLALPPILKKVKKRKVKLRYNHHILLDLQIISPD
ncbi:MAG: hypothetical protein QGG48_09460 [Desulfatiglandales bacterium]|jgi:TctA family transporter|nr:hypothetical protein [Desulfatiglandales bacterium]